jgi:hypothetical protein
MTDTTTQANTPAVFTTTGPVALARPAAPAAVPATDHLGSMMEMARMLAAAKQAIPSAYQQNPGAVMLALGFAESRGLDILTVVGSVAFVGGKPIIDATLQRALAKRGGYTIKVTEASTESATVEVWENGVQLGAATYTIADATTAGLAGKDNWRKNPEDMLVARATTRAIRRHAPDVMTGVLAQDEADEADPTAVAATPAVAPPPAVPAIEAAPQPEPAQPPLAAAEPATPIDGGWSTVDDLKNELKAAGITQAVAIGHATTVDPTVSGLAHIITSEPATIALTELISSGAAG